MGAAARIVAAALAGSFVAALVVGVLASGAGGQQPALVTLQVTSRGPGTVTASPTAVGAESLCPGQKNDEACEWRYERGTTVELRATTDAGAGKSFFGWSDPDCGSSNTCTVKLDEDLTSVVAVFSPLMLAVKFSSGDSTTASVAFEPEGPQCPVADTGDDSAVYCRTYPPHTPVRLTVAVAPGSPAFSGWRRGGEYACEPVGPTSCTIAVEDSPTWVGVRFVGDAEDQPPLPTSISVDFKVRKSGNGSGRVTATRIDCGTVCSTNYGYGRRIMLTAQEDDGSYFDGWNGVCAKTQKTCTFAAGPITSIRAVFARDTTAPSAPGAPQVRNATRTSIAVGWAGSTDDRGVAGYRVYLNDAAAGDTRETEHTLGGLTCDSSYTVGVDAVDANGNRSQRASTTVRTLPCALAAQISGAGTRRVGRNRIVVVKLVANRVTTGRLRLYRGRQLRVYRGRRVVASGRYNVKPQMNTFRLRVPRKLRRGWYLVKVTLVNPDGGTLALPGRRLRLPRP
jgi:hypothetical protein